MRPTQLPTLALLVCGALACSASDGGGSVGEDGGVQVGGSAGDGGAGGGTSGTGGTSGASGKGGKGGAAGSGAQAGTSGAGGSANSGSGGSSADPFDQARQRCLERINQFRATEGKPPYERWSAIESCTDGEARKDSMSGKAHDAFPECGEAAQNECPGYKSLDDTLGRCLDQMWAEGPGADFQKHGHYLNMSSTRHSRVACGFYQTPSGSVWAIQNFE